MNRLAAMLEADDRRRERQQARMQPAAGRAAVFNSTHQTHPLATCWAPILGADNAAFLIAQAERRAQVFPRH